MSDTLLNDSQRFLGQAVKLAQDNIHAGGRPFGAVVVNNGEIVAASVNEMHLSRDVTDHAELLAIRAAVRVHGPDSVKGATVYASGQPCPMCLAAMRLAGVKKVEFAHSNEDGAPFSLSTAEIYNDLRKPLAEQSMDIRYVPLSGEAGQSLYEQWAKAQSKPQ